MANKSSQATPLKSATHMVEKKGKYLENGNR
jgi:hypothetical protein